MLILGWSPQQRALFAETLRDVANIAAGAMVFGQFLGGRPFSAGVALLGFAVWMTLVVAALVATGRRNQ